MEYKITEKINQQVLNEILDIKSNKGLTAEQVLKQAEKKKSALHNLFEWDNDIAGEKYRLQQARILINEVKIIIDTKEYYAFENVNITISKPTETSDGEVVRQYFTRKEIIEEPSLRSQIIERAYNNILYWKRQYECYAEFLPIIEGIRAVEKLMEDERIKNDEMLKSTKSKEAKV